MLSKRHHDLLKLLEMQGSASIAAIARELGVSMETVRRDIRPLVECGKVLRIHGAVGLAGQMGEAPFERRMRDNAAAKKAIARDVAATIRDGDSLMLDTGTTTSLLARALMGHRRLTVVTNSSDIARTLATVNGNRVYMAGGELRSDSGAAFGNSAVEFVSRFHVQHAIISAGAIDETGIMDFDLHEGEFARTVLTCGERRVVVSDASKFGGKGFVKVCGFDAVSELVTDRAPDGRLAAALQSAAVYVRLAAV
jgi:DeoR family glycerol-3-phosphate regulon repressor